jgi:hypothetical protein
MYYNASSNIYIIEQNDFEFKRNSSNSMHIAKVKGFAPIGEDSFSDSLPKGAVGSRLNSPCFSNKQREIIDVHMIKESFENSAPESTEADSDEDSFESHFDAIDELSEIFESASAQESKPASFKAMPFSRPSNPIVKDSHFFIPRCSAPASMFASAEQSARRVNHEMNFSCQPSSYKEELQKANYIRPLRVVSRPLALINKDTCLVSSVSPLEN